MAVFSNFISSAFTICMDGFLFFIAQDRTNAIRFSLTNFALMLQIYLVCRHGQQLQDRVIIITKHNRVNATVKSILIGYFPHFHRVLMLPMQFTSATGMNALYLVKNS